ncbi:universal stress protein [Chitinophaga rhizosphaerae]|uniref:universal stress protein n=1 Tax=Chitinophaga rhizosphaerae TaxID=1864947 RepID=UPI000F7FC8EE|nr:universal stress protein [Chitinophaga rhizosphaerae]
MPNSFKTIVIPVDFSANTDIAVAKALSILPLDGCTIHLLHIRLVHPLHFLMHGNAEGKTSADVISAIKLQQLEYDIQNRRPYARVYSHIVFNNHVEAAIAKKSKDLDADIIVIGKRSRYPLLARFSTVRPNRLVKASGIPVLTVKPGAAHRPLRKIILPMGDHFPGSKITVLDSIQSITPFQVTLIMFPQDEAHQDFTKHTLVNTFKALKCQSANPVNYDVLYGKNKAKALMNYCIKTEADLLIVNTSKETKINKWINSHISDQLPSFSKTAVLTMS